METPNEFRKLGESSIREIQGKVSVGIKRANSAMTGRDFGKFYNRIHNDGNKPLFDSIRQYVQSLTRTKDQKQKSPTELIATKGLVVGAFVAKETLKKQHYNEYSKEMENTFLSMSRVLKIPCNEKPYSIDHFLKNSGRYGAKLAINLGCTALMYTPTDDIHDKELYRNAVGYMIESTTTFITVDVLKSKQPKDPYAWLDIHRTAEELSSSNITISSADIDREIQ